MTTANQFHDRLVREARIRATILLKSARAGDTAALARLGGALKRRRALDVTAQELAGVSYPDLRDKVQAPPLASPARFFDRPVAMHCNHWFAHYEHAKKHLADHGGFLFPFRTQFVIVDADFMRTLLLDPDDHAWRAIGYDWVQPDDVGAFARLNRILCRAGFSAKGESHDG